MPLNSAGGRMDSFKTLYKNSDRVYKEYLICGMMKAVSIILDRVSFPSPQNTEESLKDFEIKLAVNQELVNAKGDILRYLNELDSSILKEPYANL